MEGYLGLLADTLAKRRRRFSDGLTTSVPGAGRSVDQSRLLRAVFVHAIGHPEGPLFGAKPSDWTTWYRRATFWSKWLGSD